MATHIERNKNKRNKLIIHDMTLVAPDRSRKDIGRLKTAIESTERIHIPSQYELYDIYHAITTIDGHLSGILQKRTDTITE